VQISPEWQGVIDAILADPGVTVVIGHTDVGKTTFCLQLINAAVRVRVPVSLVDADIGQSEVGPPGTIGMAVAEREVDSLDQLSPKKLYFVGSTSPVGHLLPQVVGVKRLVDEALSHTRLVLVDTTGLVRGLIGRRLKTYKIDLLQPRHLVGIQKQGEVDYLLTAFSKSRGLVIHRLPAPAQAARKPQEYRASRRRAMFYRAFHDAEGHILNLDLVVCRNTYFTTGKPVGWRYVREIEDLLGLRVLHAEAIGQGLYVIIDGQPDRRREDLVMERYNTREVTFVPASAFQHVLLGLSDASGFCLDVALLHAIDFKQRYMFVLSRIKTVSPVRVVQFGSMRVRPDGTELGRIRPGEI